MRMFRLLPYPRKYKTAGIWTIEIGVHRQGDQVAGQQDDGGVRR